MDLNTILEAQNNLTGLANSLTMPLALIDQIERLKVKNPKKNSFDVGCRFVESGMATTFMEDLMKGFEVQLNNYININPLNYRSFLDDLLLQVKENEANIKLVSRRNDKDWPSLNDAINKFKANYGTLTNTQENEYFKYRIHELLYISIDILKEVLSFRIHHSQILSDTKPKTKIIFTTLGDAVVNNEAKSQIYKILIDAKLIDAESKIFIDNTVGTAGFFYSTLILFFNKGYFTRRPTKEEYLNICQNTFKIRVSESTAKNHKTRAAGLSNIPNFPLIHLD